MLDTTLGIIFYLYLVLMARGVLFTVSGHSTKLCLGASLKQ